MSSTQFNRNKTLLAVAVGAGAVIGAAGFLIYHTLDQKRKLKVLEEHLARLDLTLSELRQAFLAMRNSMHVKNSGLSRRNSFSSSMSEYESAVDTFSTLSTDDEKFYDLNSEDEDPTAERDPESETGDTELFQEVDILLKGGDEDRLKAFNLLKKYEFEMSENPDFLWRYAKACQMQAVVSGAQKDEEAKKKYVYEGLKHAAKALEFDSQNADIHKWFAILTGMKSAYVSIKEKIESGYLFQKHVLLAIEIKPEDYSLHHLMGRFKFEVANTSWIERKVASSLFAEVPFFTYSDAITHLLEAEDLSPTPWKENRLFLARCYIGDGKYDKAVKWLDSAKKIKPNTEEDAACDQEVNILLQKYKGYRSPGTEGR